jgi:uncharacterized protein (TIGR00725 family)
MKKPQIAIIGYAGLDEYPEGTIIKNEVFVSAYELGKLFAERGWITITGGKSGVMEWANKGAQEAGGVSVGVVTGDKRGTSNKYVDVEIVPGSYNCGEEMALITMSDAVVVLGGGMGTLQELAIAYRQGKPILSLRGLGGWSERLEQFEQLDERDKVRIDYCKDSAEIVEKLTEFLP